MADALSQQQGQVDAVTQGMTGAASTLPTAPATVMSGAAAREATRPVQGTAQQQHKTPAKTAATKPTATQHKSPTTVYYAAGQAVFHRESGSGQQQRQFAAVCTGQPLHAAAEQRFAFRYAERLRQTAEAAELPGVRHQA